MDLFEREERGEGGLMGRVILKEGDQLGVSDQVPAARPS